jgi:hypothetical protein
MRLSQMNITFPQDVLNRNVRLASEQRQAGSRSAATDRPDISPVRKDSTGPIELTLDAAAASAFALNIWAAVLSWCCTRPTLSSSSAGQVLPHSVTSVTP